MTRFAILWTDTPAVLYNKNAKITDNLIALYLAGKKSAGSSLVADFQSCGDPLPALGDYWIILDSQSRPRVLVKTVRIEINKFKDVGSEIARAEGEGDLSVEYWKKAHGSFYQPLLSKWGVSDLNEAEVITEFFEILYNT